jgi:threonine dehydrogenase-like Zn-dependent dehydrogenase
MKAAVFYEPHDIRVEDIPEPTIAEDEVLVEVSACGICGSDVE